jgi:two-component system chemotaxis response regulator CheB
MASTLTLANAEISMKALSLGATDYIPKPTSAVDIHSSEWFGRELVEKVTGLKKSARNRKVKPAPGKSATGKQGSPLYSDPITLRRGAVLPAQVVAIGSSTGGPQALMKILAQLGPKFPNPILITQHMPATFTGILAEHATKASGIPATEAENGEPVKPGHIYIAPGDWHMTVKATNSGPVIQLNQNPPENYCRPAVDVMLRSLAEVYGGRLLVVILTGMGHDGLEGGRAIVEQGGTMIAQDEATSVVWGMPGAVATAGLCNEVVPLDKIAAKICSISGRAAG